MCFTQRSLLSGEAVFEYKLSDEAIKLGEMSLGHSDLTLTCLIGHWLPSALDGLKFKFEIKFDLWVKLKELISAESQWFWCFTVTWKALGDEASPGAETATTHVYVKYIIIWLYIVINAYNHIIWTCINWERGSKWKWSYSSEPWWGKKGPECPSAFRNVLVQAVDKVVPFFNKSLDLVASKLSLEVVPFWKTQANSGGHSATMFLGVVLFFLAFSLGLGI